jgi:hypothetical protein
MLRTLIPFGVSDWQDSFKDLPAVAVREDHVVEGTCKKAAGARFLFAKVKLRFQPAEQLTFESGLVGAIADECEREGWFRAICLGVMDVMLVRPATPITAFRCIVEAVESHPVDSSTQAFRLASRYAAEELLRQEAFVQQ